MDPKKQAELFYQSLAAADATTCRLLARGARMQRGRVAALNRRIDGLVATNGPQAEIDRLQAESVRRASLATSYDSLDAVIDKAIEDRALMDQKKSKDE